MKYRCFFTYQVPKYFFGPASATVDMTLDEKISSQNIKSVEDRGREIIESDLGCECSRFRLAAWSEFIDTEGEQL